MFLECVNLFGFCPLYPDLEVIKRLLGICNEIHLLLFRHFDSLCFGFNICFVVTAWRIWFDLLCVCGKFFWWIGMTVFSCSRLCNFTWGFYGCSNVRLFYNENVIYFFIFYFYYYYYYYYYYYFKIKIHGGMKREEKMSLL